MTTVARRVLQISEIEGFDIVVRKKDGTLVDVTTNGLMGKYPKEKKLKGGKTVKKWKKERFEPAYPGLTCDVLEEDGTVAKGNTSLSTVRKTYEEE